MSVKDFVPSTGGCCPVVSVPPQQNMCTRSGRSGRSSRPGIHWVFCRRTTGSFWTLRKRMGRLRCWVIQRAGTISKAAGLSNLKVRTIQKCIFIFNLFYVWNPTKFIILFAGKRGRLMKADFDTGWSKDDERQCSLCQKYGDLKPDVRNAVNAVGPNKHSTLSFHWLLRVFLCVSS